MTRKDYFYFGALVVVGALLFANLIRPVQPQAYVLPDPPKDPGPSVAVSGNAESAWVVVGTKVYFLSRRSRSDIDERTIFVIDDEDLRIRQGQ